MPVLQEGARYALPVHMIRLTETREIAAYPWVRPDEDDRRQRSPSITVTRMAMVSEIVGHRRSKVFMSFSAASSASDSDL